MTISQIGIHIYIHSVHTWYDWLVQYKHTGMISSHLTCHTAWVSSVHYNPHTIHVMLHTILLQYTTVDGHWFIHSVCPLYCSQPAITTAIRFQKRHLDHITLHIGFHPHTTLVSNCVAVQLCSFNFDVLYI